MSGIKAAVLGGSGMLGRMVASVFAVDRDLNLTVTVRNASLAACDFGQGVSVKVLDSENASIENLTTLFNGFDWIVNCIGIIKPYIHNDNSLETVRSIRVNSIFPHTLAGVAKHCGFKILQIATDCVYSGAKGGYTEKDHHDATDVYGKTKSLGEVVSQGFHHLRVSIVGPESKTHVSLLDWFLSQQQGAQLEGFINHRWNGVTTYQFGRICLGIIKTGAVFEHCQHIVPANFVSKYELLNIFAEKFGRKDLRIIETVAPVQINRTLSTVTPDVNTSLWRAAGYPALPGVESMVEELAGYLCKSKVFANWSKI